MRLGRWLTGQGMDQETFALHLSVTRETVNRWVNDHILPRRRMLHRIKRFTNGAVRPLEADWPLMRDEEE